MLKSSTRSHIRLRGVRQNNLKNFDLDLPLNQFIVVTGLSGSGKSSLAFDTLFAEGQRRYIETFSPYARQFFDRMDKPRVDRIEGIPPAIAIEQRNSVKTTRSTVGTMTEICDYMKALWPEVAQLHCRQCGNPVRRESPHEIWETVRTAAHAVAGGGTARAEDPPEALITFDLPLSEKLSLEESLALVSRQGYQRLLFNGEIVRLADALETFGRRAAPSGLTIVQDRVRLVPDKRARFVEACEQAYHFGKGRLTLHLSESGNGRFEARTVKRFSRGLHCAECDLEYREPSPALFSFNHPIGACPACKGFGRIISIDYHLALPDRSKTLAEGVVKPWQTGHGVECQQDLIKMCRHFGIPTDVPFDKLRKKWQSLVIEGEPNYGTDEEHEWPRAWYGVKGYFRWLESKAYKMHVRVLLSRYRAYTPCPQCRGARFQPETLLYRFTTGNSPRQRANDSTGNRVAGESQITLAQFYALPVREALALIDELSERIRARRVTRRAQDPVTLALGEVRSRLAYLNEVGLGYLTLDRPTRTLSGGETERVNLTTCLGTRLVNTLFVLDEPSVGLHPRDTERLIHILHQLRDTGNTVVVVEHETAIMRAADEIIDLGPGHGATGGEKVFQGSWRKILNCAGSLTGQYLSGRKQIEIPPRRTHVSALTLAHANLHNLQDLTVDIPLERFVCLTGVSGSGKTTLMRGVLWPMLQARLNSPNSTLASGAMKASDRIDRESDSSAAGNPDDAQGSDEARSGPLTTLDGCGNLRRAVLVDQSILGKTPRSNPAVYIGAFDDIREFFAQSPSARRHGLNASAFSFNSTQGQCERCRGAGFEKIEMQFLSDVFIRCPECNGRRYRSHILDVKCEVRRAKDELRSAKGESNRSHFALHPSHFSWSIADLLDATVDEAIEFLAGFDDVRPAKRAAESLKLLQEVGLGYLCLGQPINTLSGGERQRLKLVRHLAEAQSGISPHPAPGDGSENGNGSSRTSCPTLFLFDEPTTGLHFEDVRVLLRVFQRLVDAGHSVLVVEHNLDVIKSADWVIDLGPDAGDKGGQIVAQGTPEDIAGCETSHTGQALKSVLKFETKVNA